MTTQEQTQQLTPTASISSGPRSADSDAASTGTISTQRLLTPDPARPKGKKSRSPKQKVAKQKASGLKSVSIKVSKSSASQGKGAKAKSSKPSAVKDNSTIRGKAGAAAQGTEPFDLHDSQWFLNRELTWLSFNSRVLHEAEDQRTPLLERLKFIAIVSGNLDEFFMKRIGGLKQQVGAGMRELSLDGRTARQQVAECYAEVRALESRKEQAFREICALLEEKNILIERYDELTPKEKKLLREFYYTNIFPLLTPQSIDPAHPFPFISNLSLNLLVALRYPKAKQNSLVRIKVPVNAGTPRFIRIGKGEHFIRLEEVMMNNLDMLFPGMEIVSCELFRVTRNANTEKDEEEADDLMAMIESELKERKFASIVRLEIGVGMDPVHRGRLAAELELDEATDVFEVPGLLAMRDLFELTQLDFPRLHDTPHHPVDHAQLQTTRNIFHIIRDAGAILLQHPYESFSTSVERFLREAATDPKVRGIKMTLYRTSRQSRIIDALILAAHNGKQVAVVVELKARFDEATNISLAERMEEAGVHVTYGVVGLKTHCKVIMVVRQDYNGLRRYLHLGTGNYHADTARLYSDVGILTCDQVIAEDVTELFNFLTTGFMLKRKYSKLALAPRMLKKALLDKIEREITVHLAAGGGLIQFKINALEDGDVVRALYRASMAGVKIDLIVRDTCRLRPGISGLSENVRVVSVVGRFLEHARIYYFRNGGAEEYFIASADAMKRNLEARVEILCPVEPPELAKEIRTIFETHLADQRSAWDMQPDGSYIQRTPVEGQGDGSHRLLIARAEKRVKDNLKKKKAKKTRK